MTSYARRTRRGKGTCGSDDCTSAVMSWADSTDGLARSEVGRGTAPVANDSEENMSHGFVGS